MEQLKERTKNLSYSCELLTPMFMSGADGRSAELRAPSIKGQLRFWWRALNPHRLVEESKIFGSVAPSSCTGGFRIRVHASEMKMGREPLPKYEASVDGKNFKMNILEYLVYGTTEYSKEKHKQEFLRDYILPGLKFNVQFIFTSEAMASEVLDAFGILQRYGGLGAKSRNGFGHFEIFSSEKPELPAHFPSSTELPQYTAFSGLSQLYRHKEVFNSWHEALAELGKIYRECRTKLEPRHEYVKRQYIAAPIVTKEGTESFLARRAKPYFLSVRKEGANFRGYILFLSAGYCDGLQTNNRNKSLDHSKVNKNFLIVTCNFNQLLLKSGKLDMLKQLV